MFLGKIRNRISRFEKERTENNAARAAAIERHNSKGKRFGQTDIIIPQEKEKKSYTQKEWSRFGDNQKDILTNRYEVTLSNHQTRNEKIKSTAKKINMKNFDKGMAKFDGAQKQFWSEWDKGMGNSGMKKGSIYPKKSNNKKSRIF
jgi:hypothetical protein